jgi:RHS repeat-associated protein
MTFPPGTNREDWIMTAQIVKANWYKYDESGASPTTACESGAYYYFYDALGNVNGVLEEKNGLYHYYRWEMDAFGNDLSSGNDFLPMDQSGPKEHLTGKMYDTVTGLYYFHARWYDPEVGRFVGRDLLPEVFASPGKYCFVRQNPLNLVDPDGRFSTPPVFSETELPEWLRWFRGFRLMRKDVIAHESSSKGSAERYHCWGDPNNVKGGEAKVMGALPDVLTKNWLALGIYGRLFEGQWAARCEPTPLGEFFKGDCIYCKGDFTFYGFRAKVKLQIANKYIPYPVGSIAFFEWIDDGLYWTTASAPICMVGGEGGAGCNGWN